MRHAGIDDRAQFFPHSLALGERQLRSSSYVALAAQLVAQIIRRNWLTHSWSAGQPDRG
jgi:hypothetical protein